MKNALENDQDEDDGIILPKKKGDGKSKKLSPVMEVMKAVTKAATSPGKKKKPAVKPGPSKANTNSKKQRIDKEDGPSAEEKGEA